MTYLKYAWPTEGQFIADMLSSGFAEMNEGEVSFVNCAVHQIGLVETDPRWAVDIIFYQEIPTEFSSFVVWPTPDSAVHWFGGWEQQYAVKFCEVNPTSPYCVIPQE